MNAEELAKGLSYDRIKEVVESKGYEFFDDGEFNLNLGGIRCTVDTNLFDDLLYCAYKENGQKIVKVWPATTDPGAHWLKNPLNKKGTAILVPGQYRGVYKIDNHGKSGYKALCQRAGKVKVYRDGDKDLNHDMDPATEENGYFGINIHRSNPFKKSYQIDKWSAGCQVHSDVDNFFEMMRLAQISEDIHGDTFTYTLFEIKDFTEPIAKPEPVVAAPVIEAPVKEAPKATPAPKKAPATPTVKKPVVKKPVAKKAAAPAKKAAAKKATPKKKVVAKKAAKKAPAKKTPSKKGSKK